MNFEKWQALGNDYMIVDEQELPFDLTPARVRRLCAPHVGLGSDGILQLAKSDEPGFVAALRIFNPDGSEAELSGNGVRQALLYLRRSRWTDENEFSIQTMAGEIRGRITSATTCRVDMGRARLRSDDFPSGPDDGRATLTADGTAWRFQHINIGNPQCSIEVESEQDLAGLDLGVLGPGLENHQLFPNRSNLSWYTVLAPGRIRARIFERGVGETSASGTGAIGAAVAYAMTGGESPVTVVLDGGELEVAVGEDLHIDLSGWAVPVARGTFAEELMEELRESQ